MKEQANRIGKILFTLRESTGADQKKLCFGLCSKTAYSRYEMGEVMPDRLLLNAFLQRMGKAADKLEMVLDNKEYQYLMWKRQALEALEQEDAAALRELLEDPKATDTSCNEKLQRQFLYRVQAGAEEKDAWERKAELLKAAVGETMPGILDGRMENYLVSVEEMQLLLDLAELLIHEGREKEAETLLTRAWQYAELHYEDYEVRVKVAPRMATLLAPLRIEQKKYLECMLLCQKAIELLCYQGILYDLAKLLEYYLRCSREGLHTEEAVRYEKQLQALKEVYEEYGADSGRPEGTLQYYRRQDIYLAGEMIRWGRIGKSLSQEELSEGICSPEAMSRIETGRHAPSVRNFRALTEKLDMEQDYFNARLDTTDFEVLEKECELDRAISLRKLDEAQRYLDEIKEKLDMDSPLNARRIRVDEACILHEQGKLEDEKFLAVCEWALGCGKEEWRQEKFWRQFLTSFRAEVLNYIALVHDSGQKRETAIYIWENILKWLRESKVRLSDRYGTSMTAVSNLSSSYGEAGRLDDCLRMCEEGVQLCLESGRGVRLAKFLGNKGEAMWLMREEKEACQRYLRQAYYISDLLKIETTNEYTDWYYRECFEKDVEWY